MSISSDTIQTNTPVASPLKQIEVIDGDIEFLSHNEAVQNILRVLSYTTGLRITLVARLTPDSWTACAVLDEASFGLEPGTQLEVETTFCNVVRTTMAPLVLNNAKQDPQYGDHVAIKMYNVENYIAVPVYYNGNHFGVLCGLDVVPFEANLNENTVTIFKLLSQLITSEMEAEERRRSSTAQISALNDIISIAAHDLRQPLTAMQLRTQLAIRRAQKEKVSPQLEVMLTGLNADVRRASALTDVLLDVGRIETGEFSLQLNQVDLVQLVTKATEDISTDNQKVYFELELPTELKIQADETRLGQVVRNLLENALKYSPDATNPIEVRLSSLPDQTALLQVRDYGMGVKEADLPKLFQRQFRTEEAKLSGLKGSGYGLYITQKFVEAHKGRIWADLPAGSGLRFNVILPAI